MNITIAEHAGFCFGVEAAYKKAIATPEKYPERRKFTLGDLIHNPTVIDELQKKNISSASLEDMDKGDVMIIRAHGITKEQQKEAEEKGLTIVDATCPTVKKVQDKVDNLTQQGYHLFITGKSTHPEIRSVMSRTNGNAEVIQTYNQLTSLPLYERTALLSQTTFNGETFRSIEERLKQHYPNLETYKTICNATLKRQEAAAKLAQQSDVMIVVGGKNSSNTKALYEICEQYTQSFFIQHPDELQHGEIPYDLKIGITAGASTPNNIIQQTKERIEQIE